MDNRRQVDNSEGRVLPCSVTSHHIFRPFLSHSSVRSVSCGHGLEGPSRPSLVRYLRLALPTADWKKNGEMETESHNRTRDPGRYIHRVRDKIIIVDDGMYIDIRDIIVRQLSASNYQRVVLDCEQEVVRTPSCTCILSRYNNEHYFFY